VSSVLPRPRVASAVVHLPLVETESPRLIFRRISPADGLSQTRVAQIVQDDLGFMWFGTESGLNRYDGYEFRVFIHDPERPNSLAGSFIYSLFKDRSGFLWIGCNQTLDRFDPRTETFTHYRVASGGSEVFGGTVVHISQDRSGMLWLATATGLHRLNAATGEILHFRHSLQNPTGLSTDDIKWTGEDRSGHFWVGTSDGLDEFDRDTGTVKLHIPIPDAIRIAFFEDRAGRFWIFHASGNGLAFYDNASNTVTQYSFYAHDPPADELTGVMDMVEDTSGNLWLGSMGVGLVQFDGDRRRFVHYGNRPGDPNSIAEDKVIALARDREGNIWTGLHSVGPNHFSERHLELETFTHEPDKPNSLTTSLIGALYPDPRGVLWVGNDQGLNEIDRKSGTRTVTNAGLGPIPTVISIAPDPDGTLWCGTYGNGLVSYDPRTHHYKVYRHDPADPGSLSSDQVMRVFLDHAGNVWLGTGNGLDRFDRATQTFRTYRLESGTDQVYQLIAEDAAGSLWLGTRVSGLQRFDPQTGHFTVYKSVSDAPSGLRDNTITSVYVSASHLIWIGTINGLNSLDPSSGRFTAYDVRSGMPGNDVGCVLEDDHGNLWLSTNKGLSKLNPSDRTFTNYTSVDGLPGDDLTGWSACAKSSRGEMFFGGFAGAVGFFPDKLQESLYAPPVVLTNFEVLGASVAIGPHGPMRRSIAYTGSVTLSHEQNILSVTFAGLHYYSPETTRYRYKLDGLDSNWYEVGSKQRRATYTTLPAGAYTFRVQSATARGAWNEPGTSLQVVILPAWWATWWFRAIYVALFVLAMWIAYVVRVRQLSRQLTMRMQERVNERIRIARELHDTVLQGLASASLQLEVADRQIGVDATAKPLVQRVSQLMRQLIDEARQTVRGLRLRQSEEENLERALTQISKDLATPRKVKYQVVVEGTPRSLRPLVREEIYRIGGEALANAFRHARASTVETVLEYGRDHFRLLVRDDGKGIDPEVLKGGREGHFGLSGLRERASKIGARLKIRTATGAGTEIDLLVPAVAAFEQPAPGGPMYWIAKLYSRDSRP
jgi:signal transduction histidine kinase/ligand-binding sensor domain-containing protein